MDKQEFVAYEIAQLTRENRELREQIMRLNEVIAYKDKDIEQYRKEIEELRNIKKDEQNIHAVEECDIAVFKGDRIVITWTESDAHAVGEVYEVSGIRNAARGGYNLSLKKFNEDGTEKSGAGCRLSIHSSAFHWRKVDNCTPLSERIKVVDKVTKDRWGCENEQYHYEYKNLFNIENL